MAESLKLQNPSYIPSQPLSASHCQRKLKTGSLVLRKLSTPPFRPHEEATQNRAKPGKKGNLQKYLGLTATSLQVRDKSGAPLSQLKRFSSQSKMSDILKNPQAQKLQADRLLKKDFYKTHGSQLFKAPLAQTAVPLQQNYQMFLPNKIKKDFNFKQNFDCIRPATQHPNKPNSITQIFSSFDPPISARKQNNYIISEQPNSHQGNFPHGCLDQQLQENDEDGYNEPFCIKTFQMKPQQEEMDTLGTAQAQLSAPIELDEEQNEIQDHISYENEQENELCLDLKQVNNSSSAQESFQAPLSPVEAGREEQKKKLYVGKQLGTQNSRKDEISKNTYQKIAPYGSHHDINDMFYSGGFLLKPKHKISTYLNPKKETTSKPLQLEEKDTKTMFQVKSLGQIIQNRQHQIQKVIDRKEERDANQHKKLRVSHKKGQSEDSSNANTKQINQLRISAPNKAENCTLFDLQSPVTADQSPKSPIISQVTDSQSVQKQESIDSPNHIYNNPIQKVLIKHKDYTDNGKSPVDGSKFRQGRFDLYRVSQKDIRLQVSTNYINGKTLLPNVKSQATGLTQNNLVNMVDQYDYIQGEDIKWNGSPLLSNQTANLVKPFKKKPLDGFPQPSNYDMYILQKQWQGTRKQGKAEKREKQKAKLQHQGDRLTGW